MRFDLLTIFPGFFDGPFSYGVLRRALDKGRLQIQRHDLRAFTKGKHQTVDDRPFGGGEGMVMKPGPIFDAVESLGVLEKASRDITRERVVLLSAQGVPFTQAMARELSTLERCVLICGRYEGVDERVNDLLADMELSVGDFVLSGGELAAAIVVDVVARLLPGVLGNADSTRYESFGAGAGVSRIEGAGRAGTAKNGPPSSSSDPGGLLDCPQYTRPAVFRGVGVPEVLLGGDHEQVRRWRRLQSLQKTLRNRPSLLDMGALSKEDRALLEGPGKTRGRGAM